MHPKTSRGEGLCLPSVSVHMRLYLLRTQRVRKVRPRKRVVLRTHAPNEEHAHRSSAVAAGNSHVAVTPQNIARTRLADGYHSSSTSHLSLALMRQFNAKLTICPRDQAGAVERIRSLGAPNVRATDTRASVGIRGAIVSRGAAAARIDDGASAATVAAATVAAAALVAAIIAAALVAAIVASAALVAAAVTAGSCSCSLRLCLCLGSRCGSGRSLLLLRQGTRLFVEGIHKVGGVLHSD